MKKLLYIFAILLASITVNAQYTNVGNGLQRKIVGVDTTFRFSLAPGYMYPATRYWVSQQLTGLTPDSTVFRTVANSLSLAQLQTKFNGYVTLSTAQSIGNAKSFVGTVSFTNPITINGGQISYDAGVNRIIGGSGGTFNSFAYLTDLITGKTIGANTTGSAAKLTNVRAIGITGLNAVAANFDGSSNVDINVVGVPTSLLTGVVSVSNGGAGSVNGLLKANGSGLVSQAVAGTDYVIPSALTAYELLANKSTSTALGTSNTLYPTQNAVKAYVDTKFAAVPIPTLQQVTDQGNSTTNGVTFGGPIVGGDILRLATSTIPISPGDYGYGADVGTYTYAKAGTINDYTLFNNAGTAVFQIPMSTSNALFASSVRAGANDGNPNTLVRNTDLSTYALDANVVHKTGTETIAGIKTFSDPLTITNTDVNGVANFYQRPYIVTSRPDIQFSATGDGTDGKNWNLGSTASDTFTIQTVTDAGTTPKTAMGITRSGNNISKVYFPQTAPVIVGGSTDDGSGAKLQVTGEIKSTTNITATSSIYATNGGAYIGGQMRSNGLQMATVTKNSNYTATINDYTIRCNAVSGNITITLPNVMATGVILTIKKIDSSANTVTVQTAGAETIDGTTSKTLSTQWDFITIQSNGGTWDIISQN